MESKRLLNKKAIITGAAHGIGRAIALAFAREGASLVVTYQKDESAARKLTAEVASLGAVADAVCIDCSDLGNVDVLFEHARKVARLHRYPCQ